MKILVVGDSCSIFIKQYIEYVLLDGQNEVVLVQEGGLISDYKEFYKKNGVQVEPLKIKENELIMKIPIIRSILGVRIWCKKIIKKYGAFDLVHVHGLDRSRGNIALGLKKHTKKTAISVWGDEIFRKDPKTLEKYTKYYDIADYITLITNAMKERFLEVYKERYEKKITINKFAIGEFEYIDKAKQLYTREEICREFGIKNSGKRIIFIGHNGREAQRHFELTNALKTLDKKELEQITLLYTMTYGVKNPQYLEDLEKEAKSLGCDYVILKEFLNEEKIAKLRIICDVLLHAQLTDSFSASIQECLYAGSVILNGDWLIYGDLPNAENRLIEYSDFEDMTKKLRMVLSDYETYKEKFKDNQNVLRSISSIETTTKNWKQALNIK